MNYDSLPKLNLHSPMFNADPAAKTVTAALITPMAARRRSGLGFASTGMGVVGGLNETYQ